MLWSLPPLCFGTSVRDVVSTRFSGWCSPLWTVNNLKNESTSFHVAKNCKAQRGNHALRLWWCHTTIQPWCVCQVKRTWSERRQAVQYFQILSVSTWSNVTDIDAWKETFEMLSMCFFNFPQFMEIYWNVSRRWLIHRIIPLAPSVTHPSLSLQLLSV